MVVDVRTNKLKGRTDYGWLASLVNALRTMGDKVSTGNCGEYWLVLDWDSRSLFILLKVQGLK